MDPADLALEMQAARQRREEKTARQIREARAYAIRAAMPPGSARLAIEERARTFYPRLSPELIEEAVALVYVEQRGESSNSDSRGLRDVYVERMDTGDTEPRELMDVVSDLEEA